MPKLIFTSHYLRDAPSAQLENYVRYIGTREGVEKCDRTKELLPATEAQKKFIKQLIRDIPASKEMLEYTDFLLQPIRKNATEFISRTFEQHVDMIGKRENYVDYIANRPRVERIGEHGLFTDAGKVVVLSQVQEEVARHKGALWTHVISLRREDAERLGYNHADQWQSLLRSKRSMLCRHMKIQSENLRWYAAFHNEGHHPHVHLMVYSAKDNDGFLTEKSIDAMRSELAHDIFRQDFAHIYEEQSRSEMETKRESGEYVHELIEDLLKEGHLKETAPNAELEKILLQLSKRLKRTQGKKVYGYLKRDVKNLVDQAVDILGKDTRISGLYAEWGKWQDEIIKTYQNQGQPMIPMSQNPKFKSIKNMVIREALRLDSDLLMETEEAVNIGKEMSEEEMTEEEQIDAKLLDFMYEQVDEDAGENEQFYDMENEAIENWTSEAAEESDVINLRVEWSREYKAARKLLYSGKKKSSDNSAAVAFKQFQSEADSGNILAMCDLARMYEDGLGCEADPEQSRVWYEKALSGFIKVEKIAGQKIKPYLWYRIGKMYATGQGCETDYKCAAEWLTKSSEQGHKYARYSLAGLYAKGQGVEQDFEKAFNLYKKSADQGNPYACYETAKMYQQEIGTETNEEQAEEYFQYAFQGFMSFAEKGSDDKLLYRLGKMLHEGIGTEKDDELAEEYWKRAADLENANAQYALGKLILQKVNGDPVQAAQLFKKAADKGHTAALYELGKLYQDGIGVEKNLQKAIELLKKAAKQNNSYAAYRLGKIYLFAESEYRNRDEAIKWLKHSADQGNQYAVHLLEHLDHMQHTAMSSAVTNLMIQIGRLFEEEHRKVSAKHYGIDRKRRRKLSEKKQAQGHKWNDREPDDAYGHQEVEG